MTKLNRLAIAAGAASALGALAAAGKGVNAAMGGRPAGARLERAQRSPAYRAGAFHNTSRGTSSMPSGQRDVLRRFRENAETRRPALPIPVVTATHEPRTEGVHVTWFGHASCLVELDGVRLLMDPVWSERCSPSQHVGPRRLHAVPVPLTGLGRDRRRRHLARPLRPPRHGHHPPAGRPHATPCSSCRSASARTSTPGACRRRASSSATGRRATTCAACGSPRSRPSTSPGAGLRRDGTLWASWVLAGRAGKVFFSGDTGFFDGYARLGAEHGPFDVSLMAVGAYDPAWHDIHLDPEEAVEATRLLRGGLLVPIHWCTFVLAPHPWAEPVERLLVAAERRGRAGGGAAGRRPGRRGRPARAGRLVGAAAGRQGQRLRVR